MQSVAFTAGQILHSLLLITALEVKAADIGARVHFIVSDLDDVETIGYLFPYGAAAVEVIAALVDIGQLHAIAQTDGAAVGLFGADQHFEQG